MRLVRAGLQYVQATVLLPIGYNTRPILHTFPFEC